MRHMYSWGQNHKASIAVAHSKQQPVKTHSSAGPHSPLSLKEAWFPISNCLLFIFAASSLSIGIVFRYLLPVTACRRPDDDARIS